jgi:hypothetical protein
VGQEEVAGAAQGALLELRYCKSPITDCGPAPPSQD